MLWSIVEGFLEAIFGSLPSLTPLLRAMKLFGTVSSVPGRSTMGGAPRSQNHHLSSVAAGHTPAAFGMKSLSSPRKTRDIVDVDETDSVESILHVEEEGAIMRRDEYVVTHELRET